MAKLKVSGSASGTGTITLIAPATNTSRTITLPDESITLSGGSPSIDDNGSSIAMTIIPDGAVCIGETSAILGLDTQLSVRNNDGNGYAATFLNDGNDANRWGLAIACGSDSPSTTKNYPIKFMDGDGTAVGNVTFDNTGVSYNGQNTAKAWVNFNGTAAAASMIRDSHNVSSITDNGTGNYTVNFSSAMANTSYSVHGTVGGDSGNGALHAFEVHVNGYSTSSSKVLSAYVANSSANRTQYDESYMNVLYFGD